MIKLREAEQLAMHLARQSGRILLENLHKIEITHMKDKGDFCTNLDIKVEKLIIDAIKGRYPGHDIISEELGELGKKSDYTWVIDPIDGTKNFVKDIPLFTISIALQYKDELVLGVVFNPSTHHMYHAYKGHGAWLNNNRIYVSKTSKLDISYIYLDITKIHNLPKKEVKEALKRLDRMITESYRVRALGVGSLGMCFLAQGAYDVYFDLTGKTKYVDIAAGSVIVKEAGGYVSDLHDKTISKKTKHLLASNALLHGRIMKLLTGI
jgi:myo-inositol-1(or 4)-monophosphatase